MTVVGCGVDNKRASQMTVLAAAAMTVAAKHKLRSPLHDEVSERLRPHMVESEPYSVVESATCGRCVRYDYQPPVRHTEYFDRARQVLDKLFSIRLQHGPQAVPFPAIDSALYSYETPPADSRWRRVEVPDAGRSKKRTMIRLAVVPKHGGDAVAGKGG